VTSAERERRDPSEVTTMSSTPFPRAQVAYSLGEEIANAATHALGVALSAAGLALLVVLTVQYGDSWQLASAIVYGVSLVLLYTASTLYHAIPLPRAKRVLKVVDHSAIYLLIAGSYTPFTLITLRSAGGLWLFAIIWGIGLAGMAVETFIVHRPKWVSAIGYIAMGWLVVTMVGPLLRLLSSGGLWLLLAGGLSYTLGTVFYVMKRVPYMHAVWHGFVLGGSICHFLAVALYVVHTPA
jgi:hemolysin III